LTKTRIWLKLFIINKQKIVLFPGGKLMLKIFEIILSVLFVIAVAVPALGQKAEIIDVQQVIKQQLAENGAYVDNSHSVDGLRCIQILSDSQVAVWGLGDFRYNNGGQLVLPLGEFTRTFIDLSDPHLQVTVGDNNRYLGQLIDSCLATGYPEKMKVTKGVFWHCQGRKNKP
jgi:hypothetical protein